MQPPVRIIQHGCLINFEDSASGRELLTTHGGEFLIALRAATMAAGLSGRQANYRSFKAAVSIKPQCASEV